VSAFANCGRAVAHVRGSYVPKPGLPPWGPHVRFRRVQTFGPRGSSVGQAAQFRLGLCVSGDAVLKLDWTGDGAERLEAFPGAKDRHVAIVEHAPED